jgi:hypothetical protein
MGSLGSAPHPSTTQGWRTQCRWHWGVGPPSLKLWWTSTFAKASVDGVDLSDLSDGSGGSAQASELAGFGSVSRPGTSASHRVNGCVAVSGG